MAFVVEDGTGVSNANAYISVAFYRAYFADRGRDVSAQTDQQVQGYIVRATDFVESRFGQRYQGTRKTLTQALGMPRTGMTLDGVTLSSDAVPAMFSMGIAEYAFRASKYADLAPDAPVPFEREAANGDAIAATGAVIEYADRQTERDATTRDNRDQILAAPNAADSAGDTGNVGLGVLCQRPAYIADPVCVRLKGSAATR